MGAKLHSRMRQVMTDTERRLDAALLDMSGAIMRTSQVLAPKKTRALVKSHKITRKGIAFYRISAGNSQVPYAAAQEVGYFTLKTYVRVQFPSLAGADSSSDEGWRTLSAGRHYFKSYSTAGTGKEYMKRAVEAEKGRLLIHIRKHARSSS